MIDRAPESGLEVEPSTSPQIVNQPYPEKYGITSGAWSHPISNHPDTSDQSHRKSQSRFKNVWILAITGFICLAVAIGAGLGAGLAAQHKPSSSSDAPTATIWSNDTPATVNQAGNAPVTLTESQTILTSTSTPSTPPSAICPAANGSIYNATNKPHLTINSGFSSQINQTSLSFEVLCYTNFVQGNVGSKNSVMDLQLISNISSLADCMDACALYNFQMRGSNFPAYACTGLAWGVEAYLQQLGFGWPVCRLKNNVTLSSTNDSATFPGYDAAVLLNI